MPKDVSDHKRECAWAWLGGNSLSQQVQQPALASLLRLTTTSWPCIYEPTRSPLNCIVTRSQQELLSLVRR